MSCFHGVNTSANVYNDGFELNSIIMPLGAFDSQYDDSINDFVVDSLVLVSNNSTHSQQPSADNTALSSHPLSLNSHPSSNEFSPGNQLDVLGLNNDFSSFITGPMNGHFPIDNVGAFNLQDQGQLVADTAQPNSHFLVPTSPLPTPIPQTVADVPWPSILPGTSQHTPLQSRQRAITPSGGLHLCHNHHNLIQSFAEFKPSVSFIQFTPSSCVLCTKRQSNSFQATRSTAARSVPRPVSPRTNRSARSDTHSSPSSHTTGVCYCSFAGCNVVR